MKKYLLLLSLILSIGCDSIYSTGSRAGVVSKFSKKGVFCKTWEGDLMMTGFVSSPQGLTPNIWSFTVEDEEIAKKVLDAQLKGKRVLLDYNQKMISPPCQGDSDYFVKNVQVDG